MKLKYVYIIIIFLTSCSAKVSTEKQLNQNYKKIGKGSPTVILIAGLGDDLSTWYKVQKDVGKKTTVITYDRYGLGKSSGSTNPRTATYFAMELEELLEELEVQEPYVLVGHSMGGYIARMYAHKYSDKVSGIVLVDASNEYGYERMMELKTEEEKVEFDSIFNGFYENQPEGIKNEFLGIFKSGEEMKTIPLPEELPITVINSVRIADSLERDMTFAKKELTQDWLKERPHIRLIETTKSGHYIHHEEPELVIEEILRMVNEQSTE